MGSKRHIFYCVLGLIRTMPLLRLIWLYAIPIPSACFVYSSTCFQIPLIPMAVLLLETGTRPLGHTIDLIIANKSRTFCYTSNVPLLSHHWHMQPYVEVLDGIGRPSPVCVSVDSFTPRNPLVISVEIGIRDGEKAVRQRWDSGYGTNLHPRTFS